MAEDGLQWFEAALGAVSKINDGEKRGLDDARCPKCDASDFVQVADLFAESVGRLEEPGDPSAVRDGGLTDAQIVARFAPPSRTSAAGVGLGVGLVLSAIAFFLYKRYGELVGEISLAVVLVVTAIVLLTTLRSFSDRYYHRRQQWNRLYMCRKCGQLVSS
ncbi:MAG: hypothetical protein ABJF01_15735 [bacterium]